MGTGYLLAAVTTDSGTVPIPNAAVTISQGGNVLYNLTTDANGQTVKAALDAPDRALLDDPNYNGIFYSKADVSVKADGFPTKKIYGVMIVDTRTMVLPVNLTPIPAEDFINEPNSLTEPDNEVYLPDHRLVTGGTKNQESAPQRRTRILPEVIIPRQIVVHLGRPGDNSTNVPVDFKFYIKNVCTYEICPNWHQAAIEANIYCQISLALNRIYTEWYRSQGYDYDITSSTTNDQCYVHQGGYDEVFSATVDRMFNQYVRKIGRKEPFFTEYCDGNIVTGCPGLKQCGSEDLAIQGYSALEILQYYYGQDIEIVETYNIADAEESYPGYPLTEGMSNSDIKIIQDYLNRIRIAFPSIPQITDPNGYFGPDTADAVKAFKAAANWDLPSDSSSVIDKATWYNISYAYYAVKKLGELGSEGEIIGVGRTPPNSTLTIGARGTEVGMLEYILNVISEVYPEVPSVIHDYYYGQDVANAVAAFEQAFSLNPDGITGPSTWNELFRIYWAIIDSGLIPGVPNDPSGIPEYPGSSITVGSSGSNVAKIQNCLNNIGSRYPSIPRLTADGIFGNATRNAVMVFQGIFGLTQDGIVGPSTWNMIFTECNAVNEGLPDYPGYAISFGDNNGLVLQVQKCLNNVARRYPSIGTISEDGKFGAGTLSAVKAFQNIFGLTADGVVGPATWAKLMTECQNTGGTPPPSLPSYPGYYIGIGSRGDYVRQVQECLNNIGNRYPSIPKLTADGVFGNGTYAAVKEFQRIFGMAPDGIVGASTWNRLTRECSVITAASMNIADSRSSSPNLLSASGSNVSFPADNRANGQTAPGNWASAQKFGYNTNSGQRISPQSYYSSENNYNPPYNPRMFYNQQYSCPRGHYVQNPEQYDDSGQVMMFLLFYMMLKVSSEK